MYYLPRHLHEANKIGPLEGEDLALLIMAYFIAMATSVYSLLITLPCFIIFMNIKSKKERGFIKHQLYQMNIYRFQGYPSILNVEFKE